MNRDASCKWSEDRREGAFFDPFVNAHAPSVHEKRETGLRQHVRCLEMWQGYVRQEVGRG